MWCATSNDGKIINNSPLNARNIAHRVSHLATLAGYDERIITGHSMRKGTATAWMLNIQMEKGRYTEQVFFLLLSIFKNAYFKQRTFMIWNSLLGGI